MIDLLHMYFGLVVFWTTYFVGASFFPSDNVITRPSAQITTDKIMKKLLVNCLVTIVSLPFIQYIPQLFYFSPTWHGFLLKYTIMPLISEFWFYYAHRLMHHRYFYRWHSDHHAFIRSYALAGLYCSPVEMLFVNLLSVVIPLRFAGVSFPEAIVIFTLVALNVLKGHAQLHLRDDIPKWMPDWLISNWDHDLHHTTMVCNFGVLYLLDRLHGTYVEEKCQPRLVRRNIMLENGF